jgi:hypothetical protein
MTRSPPECGFTRAWYRAVTLGVEYGFNPSGNRYGNLLFPRVVVED